MINKIKQFQKDAEVLGKDKNNIEEFKLWLEADKIQKRAVDEDMGNYVQEAIDFILQPNPELELISELVTAVAEMDKEEAKHLLGRIDKERDRIFDDGLYHLPGKPLQDLVDEYLAEVEMWVEEEEEEEEGGE